MPVLLVANVFLKGQMEQGEQAGQLQGAPATVKHPRPPKAAYPCFAEDMRRELLKESNRWVHTLMTADGRLFGPDASRHAGDVTCEVASRWKALSAQQRQRWEAESQKDQKRYLAECAERGVQPKLFPHMPGQVGAARPDIEAGKGKVCRPKQRAGRSEPYEYSRAAGARTSAASGGEFALARTPQTARACRPASPDAAKRSWLSPADLAALAARMEAMRA